MLNMLSVTEKPQIFIKFKRGDIVNARGQIGVIVDMLKSAETDNICLYVRFVHNLGNVRPYDMLEISADRMLGIDKWTLATQNSLEQAIIKRKLRLDKEVEELLTMITKQNGC